MVIIIIIYGKFQAEFLDVIEEDCISSSVDDDEPKDEASERMERIEKKLDFLISYVLKDDTKSERNTSKRSFDKLATIKDLDQFEKSLANDDFKLSLIDHVENKFKNMVKYENSTRKFAYDVIDTFTDRCLFKNFSLNGKSRNGGKNLSLLDRVTYINFIFECIQKLKPEFQYAWLELVFGVLCRNKSTSTKTDSCKQIKLDEK